jgi:hypothetical protein
MKLHQHFEFGPASQDPFSFCQIQLALDTVRVTFHDACPGLELLSRELLTNSVAVAVFLVLNVYKTPSYLSRKEGMGQNSSQTPAVSLVESCTQCDRMDNKP